MKRLSLQLLLAICFMLVSVSVQADVGAYSPVRYGVALLGGAAYDPDHIDLVIIQGQMLLDYEQVAWHKAPDYLKMKFEVNAGLILDSRKRALVSVNMLALRYFRSYTMADWVPYVEAGIGVIYTDFQVKEQGLRFNFNPQAGAGLKRPLSEGAAMTIALRLHHLSNGSLHEDNRGVNSALLQIGYLF